MCFFGSTNVWNFKFVLLFTDKYYEKDGPQISRLLPSFNFKNFLKTSAYTRVYTVDYFRQNQTKITKIGWVRAVFINLESFDGRRKVKLVFRY